MVNDPVGDMLAQVRNGLRVKKSKIVLPSSKEKESVARVLWEEEYIRNYQIEGEGFKKELVLNLKYLEKGESAIKGLKRISKPSLRIYVKKEKIPKVLDGLGIVILSTTAGIISGREAKRRGVGGEVVAYIW